MPIQPPSPQRARPLVLIVDDDPLIRETIALVLGEHYDVLQAETRPQAIALLRGLVQPPELALVDLGLPPTPHRPQEGFLLITELLAHAPSIKLFALSGQDDKSNARHARSLGALDFFAKPCDPEQILARMEEALRVEPTVSDLEDLMGIVGDSDPMRAMRSQISLYATTPFPVLIEGESGSGKELVAAALQRLGPNNTQPYLIFNCAAISPNLVEAALFGHTKGAFTGAQAASAGYFEDAGVGTLFLDEIGELPLELQAKLLRVLENGEYQRVGETTTRKSRARVIAATNRNLRQEVRDGNFRNDLYHRLSVFTIHVPPLRELGTDRNRLLEHFLAVYTKQTRHDPFTLDPAAQVLWDRYPFPGNTRELRNIVIRLITKHPGRTLTASQLEEELDQMPMGDMPSPRDASLHAQERIQQPGFRLDRYLLEQERQLIDAALELCDNNMSEAAKLLGMNRSTLYNRIDTIARHQSSDRSTSGSQ